MSFEKSKDLLSQFREEVESLAALFAEENVCTYLKSAGRYNQSEFSLTLKFSLASSKRSGLSDPVFVDKGKSVLTQDKVALGLAPVGTIGYCYDSRQRLYYKAIILQVRRSRYAFEFVNYPEEGKFTISFGGFKLESSVPKGSFGRDAGHDE